MNTAGTNHCSRRIHALFAQHVGALALPAYFTAARGLRRTAAAKINSLTRVPVAGQLATSIKRRAVIAHARRR